jgi:hypothetical protein
MSLRLGYSIFVEVFMCVADVGCGSFLACCVVVFFIELISWCSWTVVMMHTVWWRARDSHTHTSAFEDGTDRGFRNVGIYIPDVGELP